MRRIGLLAASLVGCALIVTSVSLARAGDDDDGGRASARLTSYNETPQSLSTTGRGSFEARIGSASITYRLRYEGLEGGTPTQAHLHLGQQHTTGGVSVFLCAGGKPACPAAPATVEGTLVPNDVIGPGGQGITAGQFEELVRAIRAGAVYVNVHTPTYPSGEIRGQLTAKGGGRDDKDDKGKDDRDD